MHTFVAVAGRSDIWRPFRTESEMLAEKVSDKEETFLAPGLA